jgi:DNA-binding Lrp family transcriptional regulator
MDQIDRAIIHQLQANARQTNTELADHVGLTPSPCLRRVRHLEDTGIILGYHAHIDPTALDQSFEVLVDIELVDQTRSTVDRFEAALVALEPIVDAKRMFGAPDYHAIVAVKDLAAYETFVTEHLMTLPGLARLQSRFPMKTLTSHPRIPVHP